MLTSPIPTVKKTSALNNSLEKHLYLIAFENADLLPMLQTSAHQQVNHLHIHGSCTGSMAQLLTVHFETRSSGSGTTNKKMVVIRLPNSALPTCFPSTHSSSALHASQRMPIDIRYNQIGPFASNFFLSHLLTLSFIVSYERSVVTSTVTLILDQFNSSFANSINWRSVLRLLQPYLCG